MNRDELLKRLQSYEWSDFEVKDARGGVPKSIYETVSAFANTAGGHIVLGVAQTDDRFEVVGVVPFDKVQNDFLGALHSGEKVSARIATKDDVIEYEGKRVLAFYVPESPDKDKPVYLDRDIRRSFIRRGGCDQRCTEEDIRRFLRNAGDSRFDTELLAIDPTRCFDMATIERYRKRFQAREPGSPANALDHPSFLEHWGLIVDQGGTLRPTRASVLLFGTGAALRSMLPRPVVDLRWYSEAWDAPQSDERWSDRLVCEDNLFQTWEQIIVRYAANASKPFAIDQKTMERKDRPEDFVAFREGAMNLLIHQDYAEVGRPASIVFHPDRLVFTNPGTAGLRKEALLKPGEKPVRNPLIVAAFRRIGLSEQAGSGMRAIFNDWRGRGRVPPVVDENRTDYTFQLSLLAEPLLSERQLLFAASLGVKLTSAEADAFAVLCHEPRVGVFELRAVLGLGGADVEAVMSRLVVQVLARRLETPTGVAFELSAHLRERWPLASSIAHPSLVTDQAGRSEGNLVTDQARRPEGNLVTDQASSTVGEGAASKIHAQPLTSLTDAQRKLLAACDTPRPQTELMKLMGASHRSHFRKFHLQPLIDAGLLQLSFPEKPNHPAQRYALTPTAAVLVGRQLAPQTDGTK